MGDIVPIGLTKKADCWATAAPSTWYWGSKKGGTESQYPEEVSLPRSDSSRERPASKEMVSWFIIGSGSGSPWLNLQFDQLAHVPAWKRGVSI